MKLELSEKIFFDLICFNTHKIDFLAPCSCDRRVKAIARRIVKMGLSFEQLASDLGYPENLHLPSWFEPCIEIYNNFDYNELGVFKIATPTCEEISTSKWGSFYLLDGNHRALVIAVKLLENKIPYMPVTAYYTHPR